MANSTPGVWRSRPALRPDGTPRPHAGLLVRIDSATGDNTLNPAIFVLGNGHLACVGSTVRPYDLTSGPQSVSCVVDGRPLPPDDCDTHTARRACRHLRRSGILVRLTDGCGRDFAPARRHPRRGDLLRHLVSWRRGHTSSIDEVARRLAGWRLDFFVRVGIPLNLV
jgi:hypothetical protein